MLIERAASVHGLRFGNASDVTASTKRSEIECEVISLFDGFRDPVLRYVLSFGICIHDAEEVTQEVFLALFRHLRLGRGRKNLRGWIFRVAHNLALKQRHANRRSRAMVEFDWTVAESHADPSLDPEEQASFGQRRQRLLAVFNALPEDDQRCLRLRAEGLGYREIARVLGLSLGGVSMSLAKSLARFIRVDGV